MIPNETPVHGALRRGACIVAMLAWPWPADSATLRVPSAYSTIQAAINAASPGDTVLLAPGVHTGRPTLAGKAITLASDFLLTGNRDDIDRTIIDGTNGAWALRVTPGPAPTIVGVTIRNSDDGIRATGKFRLLHSRVTATTDGVDYEDGGGGLISGCVFEGNSDDAIDSDHAVNALIVDNIIRNNGDDGIEIRLQPYSGPLLSIVIKNNTILGNGEDGIQLISYDALTQRTIQIESNLIVNNAMAGVGMMCCENTVENYQGAALRERVGLYHNTIVGNHHGVTGGDSLIAVNNLILHSTQVGLKRAAAGSIAAYNLFYGNGTDHVTSNVDLATTLFQDPLLRPDFGLASASPAIDAGTAWFLAYGSLVWQQPASQYVGVAPDLGALEFSGILPVPEDHRTGSLELSAPAPNPSRGSTAFRIHLPAEGRARLEILDVTGRRVRMLAEGEMPAGRHQLTWDGRDGSGRAAPAGVYIVRLETGSLTRSLRFVRL